MRLFGMLVVLLLLSTASFAISSEAKSIGWFTGGSLILDAGKITNTNAPALALNKDAEYITGKFGFSLDILKINDGYFYYTGDTTVSLVDSNKYQRTTAYSNNGIWGAEIGYRNIWEKDNNLLEIGELYYKSQHAANPFSLTDTEIYNTYFIGYRFTMRMGSQFYK